jgi:hypothetical protein
MTVIEDESKKGVKYDQGKLMMRLIPHEAIVGLAEVLTFGANKYTPNGWQTVPDAENRYEDALLRHIYARKAGELTDPESGLSHLKHALTNLAFLVYLEEQKLERPTRVSCFDVEKKEYS